MRGAWCESESVAEAAASPQTRRALSPPLPSTPREHTKVRTQLAIFTGPAPSAPRYRAVVVSCSATRLPGGGLFCVCPAHFHCPPKVSARINAHIPASPSLSLSNSNSPVLLLSLFATYARVLYRALSCCRLSICQLCGRGDATRWTKRDAAAAATIATTAASYVRGDMPCRRRPPSRGYPGSTVRAKRRLLASAKCTYPRLFFSLSLLPSLSRGNTCFSFFFALGSQASDVNIE